MPNSVDFSGRPFHFIGIGGIGMSAVAYILAKRRLPVYGSDLRSSHITQRLQQTGVRIFSRQEAENLHWFQKDGMRETSSLVRYPNNQVFPSSTANSFAAAQNGDRPHPEATSAAANGCAASKSVPQVICSSAIDPANVEYQAALDLGCPIFHRSDVLAALMQQYDASIAVAGTHGKTTTSSLAGHVLVEAGWDPTVAIGGEVPTWQGNARVGKTPYFVAEADESDGSLVKLQAKIGIITNIELDHPDCYQSLEQVVATFQTFAHGCETVVGCADCQTVRQALPSTIGYSIHPHRGAHYTVQNVRYSATGTVATVLEGDRVLGELQLQLLGEHNLSNALAVVAATRQLGLDFPTIAAAIATFAGASRRFEIRGQYGGILFVDDYAHHPNEIQATLAAARLRMQEFDDRSATDNPAQNQRRLIAVFQPHRYSRTQRFLLDFARAFSAADLAIVSDIYGAGENNLENLNGECVTQAIAQYHDGVEYQPSLADVVRRLKEILRAGDVVLFLGAGNLNQVIPEIMEFYRFWDRPPASSSYC
ncbi:UDP-N-acetylmuramate--L-alanine ligase [Geitlerinema sp. PCC 9228]|uniref:UDP-N-acetylmuramate--L-alanine ligase n=1 Tax=Geitlerinema sp. PCC 9228 TaxID=111611 RepID=UPI0008F9ADC3|nr:UDP-N-acetylmuramate--L-alanine ligase [Geitlerinema sp. PCC 9228]